MKNEFMSRIYSNPDLRAGEPCIKGTRIMISIILDYLAAGESQAEIIRQYPALDEKDIQAAMAYAAWLAHEEEDHPLRLVKA